MTKNKKVYCINCTYFLNRSSGDCRHPKNEFKGDTWLKPVVERKKPEDLNAKNDCKWYLERL